jgi:type IV pilus assembly protein PilW
MTLLELTTSMVVTAIVLAGVAASFIAVQNVYQRESQLKSAVESSRVSSTYLEKIVRLAGYGIDPKYAIDVTGLTAPYAKSNYVDATNRFITDDFAFRYRDPSYLRRGYLSPVTQLTLEPAAMTGVVQFGTTILAGSLLMVACPGGSDWVVVRTGAQAASTASSVVVASAAPAFPAPPATLPSCLSQTGPQAPFVMLVREVRLRVIPLGAAGKQRPFLVAYNTLTLPFAGLDFDPIAADVESFQVSYMMNRGSSTPPCSAPDTPAGTANWIMGDLAGEIALPAVSGSRPNYDDDYSDQKRCNNDVANVRAVQFDISTRSARLEGRKAHVAKALADDPTTYTSDGFFHLNLSTTVPTPNLESRSFFTPSLPLNSWGS